MLRGLASRARFPGVDGKFYELFMNATGADESNSGDIFTDHSKDAELIFDSGHLFIAVCVGGVMVLINLSNLVEFHHIFTKIIEDIFCY